MAPFSNSQDLLLELQTILVFFSEAFLGNFRSGDWHLRPRLLRAPRAKEFLRAAASPPGRILLLNAVSQAEAPNM